MQQVQQFQGVANEEQLNQRQQIKNSFASSEQENIENSIRNSKNEVHRPLPKGVEQTVRKSMTGESSLKVTTSSPEKVKVIEGMAPLSALSPPVNIMMDSLHNDC